MKYTKHIGRHEFELSCDAGEFGLGISATKMIKEFRGWTNNLGVAVQFGPITFLWVWQ